VPLLTVSYDDIFLFPKLQEHVSGLDKLHIITGNKQCKLRIELTAYDDRSAWAEYKWVLKLHHGEFQQFRSLYFVEQ